MSDDAALTTRTFPLLLVATGYALLAYVSVFGSLHFRLFNYMWDSAEGWALIFLVMAVGLVRRWYLALYIGKYAGLMVMAAMLVSAIAALLAPDEVVLSLLQRELAGMPMVLLASLLAVYGYWQYRLLAYYELIAALRLR